MSNVTLTIELPYDIEEKARAAGLLTSEKLIELIEAELERKREAEQDNAIQQAREMLGRLDALEPKLTQEEIDEELQKGRSHS